MGAAVPSSSVVAAMLLSASCTFASGIQGSTLIGTTFARMSACESGCLCRSDSSTIVAESLNRGLVPLARDPSVGPFLILCLFPLIIAALALPKVVSAPQPKIENVKTALLVVHHPTPKMLETPYRRYGRLCAILSPHSKDAQSY